MGCLLTLVGLLFAGLLTVVYAAMGCLAALLALLVPVAIAAFYLLKMGFMLAVGSTITAAGAAYGGAYDLFHSTSAPPWLVGIGTIALGSLVLYGLYNWLIK